MNMDQFEGKQRLHDYNTSHKDIFQYLIHRLNSLEEYLITMV